MVNLYTAGRTDPISARGADRRLADLLIAQALQPKNKPIQSAGEGAANLGSRLVNAWMGKQLLDKEETRKQSAADTVAQALRASKPWQAPDDIYRDTDYEGGQLKPGTMPVTKRGETVPGTGGPDAMIAALSNNPDTAAMALKLAADRNVRAEELAAALRRQREGEKIYLEGRGDPEYRRKIAEAGREPIPKAAERAGAIAGAKLPAAKEIESFRAKTKAETESGQTERIVTRLQKEDPTLSYRDALLITKYAPRQDADNLRRERLAFNAAKEDPDYGLDQFKTLQRWRERYGLSPMKAPPEAKKDATKEDPAGVGSWFRRMFGGGEKAKAAGPAAGAVVGGFRFKGGNPNDRASWEAVK